MKLLAIDPGTAKSAFVLMDSAYRVLDKGIIGNTQLIDYIWCREREIDGIAVEMIKSFGKPVGDEVFETCVMIGRIERTADIKEIPRWRVDRKDEKIAICRNSRAKDKDIRRALIDRFAQHDRKNGKGTKKNPDHFYGFAADMWQAYAVGVTWMDRQKGGCGL